MLNDENPPKHEDKIRWQKKASRALIAAALAYSTLSLGIGTASADELASTKISRDDRRVHYRTLEVDGVKIFYREAGLAGAPNVLLLHGFGASSAMFRQLIPLLSSQYHVVAPDLPGFGLTEVPESRKYKYSFASIANTMGLFTDKLKFDRYAVYVFDYGAPTGYRLALRNPERITAIISQNGNAYIEGLSKGWAPIQAYWKDPSEKNRNALKSFMKIDTTKWQYFEGVPDKSLVSPDGYIAAQYSMDRAGNESAQLDLFGDYQSNVALYPKFQAFFKKRHPPLLAVWGKNDPFFLPEGAEAYRRDNPNAEIHFYDSGHFVLESNGEEIGREVLSFLLKNMSPNRKSESAGYVNGIKHEIVKATDIPGTDQEMRVVRVDFLPGAADPVHHHPVAGVGYIVEGEAESAFENGTPITLSTGQSFIDPANTQHTLFRNKSTTHSLQFLMFYTVKKGQETFLTESSETNRFVKEIAQTRAENTNRTLGVSTFETKEKLCTEN